MRHTRSSILYHALLLTGVNFLLRGVSMLFQIYLSNRVGAAGVGLMQLIFTVEAAAMTFGLSGARVAAMYLCAEEYGRRRLPGVRAALAGEAEELAAQLLQGDRRTPVTLRLGKLTREERDTILAGCLMNYYAGKN